MLLWNGYSLSMSNCCNSDIIRKSLSCASCLQWSDVLLSGNPRSC